MIRNAKDPSPDQKQAIEGLLGRPVAEDEAISVRTVQPSTAPEWLQQSWASAKNLGIDNLSLEEIDAARRSRRNWQPLEQ